MRAGQTFDDATAIQLGDTAFIQEVLMRDLFRRDHQKKTERSPTRKTRPSAEKQVCRLFNQGKCKNENCQRLHRCETCNKKGHGADTCRSTGKGKGKGKGNKKKH